MINVLCDVASSRSVALPSATTCIYFEIIIKAITIGHTNEFEVNVLVFYSWYENKTAMKSRDAWNNMATVGTSDLMRRRPFVII